VEREDKEEEEVLGKVRRKVKMRSPRSAEIDPRAAAEKVLFSLPPFEVGESGPGLYRPGEPVSVSMWWGRGEGEGGYRVVLALRGRAAGCVPTGTLALRPRRRGGWWHIGYRLEGFDSVVFHDVEPGVHEIALRTRAVEPEEIEDRLPQLAEHRLAALALAPKGEAVRSPKERATRGFEWGVDWSLADENDQITLFVSIQDPPEVEEFTVGYSFRRMTESGEEQAIVEGSIPVRREKPGPIFRSRVLGPSSELRQKLAGCSLYLYLGARPEDEQSEEGA
jgi:hypothetical protein